MNNTSVDLDFEPIDAIFVMYKNWKGVTAERHLRPITAWYGVSDFHKEEGPQWFMRAFDLEKSMVRDFAMKDMVPV